MLASRLDGIPDAVVDGVTGMLVDPASPEAFIDGLDRARELDRAAIPDAVLSRCSWSAVYREYADFAHLDVEQRDNRLLSRRLTGHAGGRPAMPSPH